MNRSLFQSWFSMITLCEMVLQRYFHLSSNLARRECMMFLMADEACIPRRSLEVTVQKCWHFSALWCKWREKYSVASSSCTDWRHLAQTVENVSANMFLPTKRNKIILCMWRHFPLSYSLVLLNTLSDWRKYLLMVPSGHGQYLVASKPV